jgi:hypothetical protein
VAKNLANSFFGWFELAFKGSPGPVATRALNDDLRRDIAGAGGGREAQEKAVDEQNDFLGKFWPSGTFSGVTKPRGAEPTWWDVVPWWVKAFLLVVGLIVALLLLKKVIE